MCSSHACAHVCTNECMPELANGRAFQVGEQGALALPTLCSPMCQSRPRPQVHRSTCRCRAASPPRQRRSGCIVRWSRPGFWRRRPGGDRRRRPRPAPSHSAPHCCRSNRGKQGCFVGAAALKRRLAAEAAPAPLSTTRACGCTRFAPCLAPAAHLICSNKSWVPSTILEPRPARPASPRPACGRASGERERGQ